MAKHLDKSALIWSCGTGKTLTALLWALPNQSLLIICPKSLKRNWEIETTSYRGRTKSGTGIWQKDTLILTKEEFKKASPTLDRFSQVIVDEVHLGFLTPNWKSQMSKALKKYLERHMIARVLLLSATPYSSSPWNVYNLAWLIGRHWPWQEFKFRFFIDVRMGPRIIPLPKKGCEVELARLVRNMADVVDINDVMDVPLQYHSTPEYFALNKEQKKLIVDAYDPLPIVRFTAEHQIEQIGDKNERIKSIVEENDKVALVCRYNAQIDILAKLLKDYNPSIIRGDVKNRHEVCLAAESSSRAVVLIQADCAEGYQLPSFPLCVFVSQSYSYVKFEQICGRFLRMDKPSRTTFMYLLVEGDSIDKAVYNAVRRKENFMVELFKRNLPNEDTREKISDPILTLD